MVQHGGLADAGFTGEHERTAVTEPRAGEEPGDGGLLSVPPDEHGRIVGRITRGGTGFQADADGGTVDEPDEEELP